MRVESLAGCGFPDAEFRAYCPVWGIVRVFCPMRIGSCGCFRCLMRKEACLASLCFRRVPSRRQGLLIPWKVRVCGRPGALSLNASAGMRGCVGRPGLQGEPRYWPDGMLFLPAGLSRAGGGCSVAPFKDGGAFGSGAFPRALCACFAGAFCVSAGRKRAMPRGVFPESLLRVLLGVRGDPVGQFDELGDAEGLGPQAVIGVLRFGRQGGKPGPE